jgi:hypothetical protein
VTLSIIRQLRSVYLRYFSKPAADRPLYRAIGRHRIKKMVELGIGDASRAVRMIEMARHVSAASEICYVGMDPFEDRPATSGAGLHLKEAHQLLRATGVRFQLVPGNPFEQLMRMANALGKVDLLIVPAELDSPSQALVWFFVPRMLHEKTLVFVDDVSSDGQRLLRLKPRAEIDRLASAGRTHRAA